jgi:hypothetical protein
MGIQRIQVQGQQHNWFPHPEFEDELQWQTDGHHEYDLPPISYDRQILRKVNWKAEGF